MKTEDPMENESTPREKRKSPGKLKRTILYWYAALPGRKSDYFFLALVLFDVLVITIGAAYGGVISLRWPEFSNVIKTGTYTFDIAVVVLWFFYFITRMRREEDRVAFLRTHWYEIVGMVPLIFLRPFLLLRGAKFAIAFYKLGRSEQTVSSMITRDITFKFRDIIVDTIADAVMLKSLQRVEEVMLRLNYSELAHRAFNNHQQELRQAVNEALRSKSIIGEISKLPFMSGFADRLGEDLSEVIMEVMETHAAGNIMKDVTRGILGEMGERVRVLDVERITGRRVHLKSSYHRKSKKGRE